MREVLLLDGRTIEVEFKALGDAVLVIANDVSSKSGREKDRGLARRDPLTQQPIVFRLPRGLTRLPADPENHSRLGSSRARPGPFQKRSATSLGHPIGDALLVSDC